MGEKSEILIMAGLDEIYELVNEKRISILDYFEESDFLKLKFEFETGVLNFSITSDYPYEPFEIKSSNMEGLDGEYIEQMLSVTMDQNIGRDNLLEFIIDEFLNNILLELREEALNVQEGKKIKKDRLKIEEDSKNTKMLKSSSRPIPKYRNINSMDDRAERKHNKIKMKTVMDVVNRILWDDDLDPDEFSIDYLDRFIGVQGKAFTDFSWKNMADIDYWEEFGVPEHRILRFKWKGEVVWNKETREDFVFGSGEGRGITIIDFMSDSTFWKNKICS